jgi:hypothetical protein
MMRTDPKKVTVSIPNLVTVSELNTREHWAVRAKRAKTQRFTTEVLLRSKLGRYLWTGRKVVVTMTRLGRRNLDDDNLAGAMKHVRDGVADWMGVDDGSPLITWRCRQARGDVGVMIQVELVEETATITCEAIQLCGRRR